MDGSTPGNGVTRRRVLQGLAAVATTAGSIELGPAAAGLTPSSPGTRQTQTLAGQWAFSTNGASFDHTVDVPNFLLPFTWWNYTPADFPEDQARIARYGYDPATTTKGWYRRTVQIPAGWSDRRIELQFDGIAMYSEISVNGTRLTSSWGMWKSHRLDITDHVTPGKDAVIEVFVQLDPQPGDWSLGEFMSSKTLGIWQDTRLVTSSPTYIQDVYFKPQLDGADIEVTVTNGSAATGTVRVRNAAVPFGGHGVLFDERGSSITLKPSETRTVTAEIRDIQPRLWSPDHPSLYALTTSLEDDQGELLDDTTTRVGFRTFEAQGNKLLLNGKVFWIRGAGQLPSNMVGPERLAQMRRWTTMLRACNVRMTRMHLGPASGPWYDVCDELGMGVDMEGVRPWVFVGNKMPTAEQVQGWKDEMADVVKRLRNHPSLLLWTTGNELSAFDLPSWTILSGVNKVIRDNDSTRPLVADSRYVRNPTFYNNQLKLAGIDDGDIDDEHVYPGWYEPSAFVIDMDRPGGSFQPNTDRPFISAEMSTGYPDFHTGMPWPSYLNQWKTPQAWVGHHAADTNPAIFLKTHALLTKELAELVRRSRDLYHGTAGFLLFSSATWFKNYNDVGISPFPVCEAVRKAYQPIVASLDSTVRHFYAGEVFAAQVVVAHDDADRGRVGGLRLSYEIQDLDGRRVGTPGHVQIPDVDYATNVRAPVTINVPDGVPDQRLDAELVLTLAHGSQVISENRYDIVVASRDYVAAGSAGGATTVWLYDPSGLTAASLDTIGLHYTRVTTLEGLAPGNPDLLVIGKNGIDATALAADLLGFADAGGRVVVLEGGAGIPKLLPNDIASMVAVNGEVVTPVVDNVGPCDAMDPMDLRWWRHADGSKPFVLHQVSALGSIWDVSNVRRLAEFYPSHGYTEPKVYFPCLMKKSRPDSNGYLLLSDLATSTAAPVDPLAGRYLANLLRQTADVPLDPPAPTWDGFSESFENGLGEWTVYKGIPLVSTVRARASSHSFGQSSEGTLNQGSACVIYRQAKPTRGKVSLWFYDDASVTSTIFFVRVDNAQDSGNWRAMGVLSGKNYAIRIDGASKSTSIVRSTGWHELVWDYTSGTGMTMSIDGVQVASDNALTEFDTIAMGDWWGGAANAGSEFIDDITVTVKP
ncbi:MAG: hypothetical protein J2P17_06200 [Mycobacterium sp.]|nr:hypothetical protein [Mycobacterium sp.]